MSFRKHFLGDNNIFVVLNFPIRKKSRKIDMILNAGRHMDYNANTLMRNPEWNQGKRACTVAVHPGDAVSLDLLDGDSRY